MLQIPATVLLIDVENMIGPFTPRLPMVRARMQALLAAAGPVEHALACFSQQWPAKDSVISALIGLGVVPWPVPPGPQVEGGGHHGAMAGVAHPDEHRAPSAGAVLYLRRERPRCG
jgi:hypothetical protein